MLVHIPKTIIPGYGRLKNEQEFKVIFHHLMNLRLVRLQGDPVSKIN